MTHAGVKQGIDFGTSFRENMYIEDKQGGGGLLRLHSTYRHDLKCYTSDEGRCQKTAAAFLKGLLSLEGALAPILVIMVRKDEATQKMLNDSSEAEKDMDEIKKKLSILMNSDEDLYTKYMDIFNVEPLPPFKDIMIKIGRPLQRMNEIYELIKCLTQNLKN